MSFLLRSRIAFPAGAPLAGALAALLALSACGEDQRNLISPEERPLELAFTVLRAELPNSNEYTARIRNLPAPAVDTFTDIPRFTTAQLARAAERLFPARAPYAHPATPPTAEPRLPDDPEPAP